MLLLASLLGLPVGQEPATPYGAARAGLCNHREEGCGAESEDTGGSVASLAPPTGPKGN